MVFLLLKLSDNFRDEAGQWLFSFMKLNQTLYRRDIISFLISIGLNKVIIIVNDNIDAMVIFFSISENEKDGDIIK